MPPYQRISDRAHQRERDIANEHQGQFDPSESRGLKFVQKLCNRTNVSLDALIQLSHVLSEVSGIRFVRDFTRRRALVIKWFDDHLEELEPLQTVITIELERNSPSSPMSPDSGDFLS
jgi:hypothetical protein